MFDTRDAHFPIGNQETENSVTRKSPGGTKEQKIKKKPGKPKINPNFKIALKSAHFRVSVSQITILIGIRILS